MHDLAQLVHLGGHACALAGLSALACHPTAQDDGCTFQQCVLRSQSRCLQGVYAVCSRHKAQTAVLSMLPLQNLLRRTQAGRAVWRPPAHCRASRAASALVRISWPFCTLMAASKPLTQASPALQGALLHRCDLAPALLPPKLS